MQAVHDETFCGPVCQHPSCWNSQRRCQRGLPRTRYVSSDSDSEDEGLPTQKVVNLLEDYGEDTRDRYPTKFGGRPKHERVGSIANLVRTKTRESFPKVRAPNATPASPMRLATLSGHNIPIKGAMNKVEVQEVFDLDDLQSDWHETFQAKKYYVWVPNPNKKKPRTPLDPTQRSQSRNESRLSLKELSRGPTVLNPKDVTEDMVPEELELQRLNEMMLSAVWPFLKRRDRRYDCKTPTGGQPYSYPLTQGGDYNGLYDLLDLPREVLADIVNHIEGRELKSKHQFVEAVIRTLPKLEKNHTAISLASSNVLLQRPIKLLDGDLRNSKGMMPFTSKQVYQLDDKVLDHLSTANEPPASQRPTDRSVDAATQGAPAPPASARAQKGEPPALNKKKPLPAIGDGEERKEDDQVPEPTADELEMADEKKKIPSIALGLPTIPTGLRYTKTFTYNQQDFDFTLCPIPSPLQAILNPSPRSNSTTPGPLPSPSSVHGTVPTDTLRQETATPGQEEPQRENTNMPSVTQMVIHMPKTPNPTPVTRQSTFITDLDTTFTPDPGMTFAKGLDPGMSPAPPTTPRQPTIVTQKSLALTPDTSGLHPIAESDQNDPANEELGPIRHQMPRRLPHSRSNHRSVHFAPATSLPLPDAPMIPPQPPSSPNESEEVSMTPTPWAVSQAQLSSANYQAFARQEAEGLMVIGKGTKGSGGLTGPAGGYILQPRPPQGVRTSNVPTTASTTSPEPWPQLDEEAYINKSLPRTPSSPPKSAGAKSGLSDATRTTEASVRHPTRSAASSGSRESSMAKRLLQQEGQLESPAPPPPSPEPRDMAIHPPLTTTITTTTTTTNPTTGITTSGGANGKSPTKSPAGSVVNPLLTMVAEGDESESDITISAKPPSNLDSVSRIQSPRSMANSRPLTRDTSLLMSREVTNASGIVIPDGEPGPSRESTQDDTSNGQWAQKEQEEQQRSDGNQGNTQQGQPAVRKSLEQFDASEESLRQELESEYEKLAKQL